MSTGDKKHPTLDDMVGAAHARLGVKKRRGAVLTDIFGGETPAPKKKNADPEHQLQCALIAVVRNGPLGIKYPDLLDLHAIPNGGKRGVVTATKIKREGGLRGVPDLFLPVPAYPAPHGPNSFCEPSFYGLYLETKVPGGYPTKEQRDFMARVVARGYACAVWRTLEEGTDLLVRYMEGRFVQTPEMLK